MTTPTTEIITMADLNEQCRDRLNYAREIGVAAVRSCDSLEGETKLETVTFETSTGVKITSIGGAINLECDFSDYDYGPQRLLFINFTGPNNTADATEVITREKGTTSRTYAQRQHNDLAAMMSRLIALQI